MYLFAKCSYLIVNKVKIQQIKVQQIFLKAYGYYKVLLLKKHKINGCDKNNGKNILRKTK